jgi:hypothetical protein
MVLTKKEEAELKLLIGLEFYDVFKDLLLLSQEEVISSLKNNARFWDLIKTIKKVEG